jgi:orotidine-5'-phosphate decarboxylase
MPWPIAKTPSIIWAANTANLQDLESVLGRIKGHAYLGGIKIGMSLVDRYGLSRVVMAVRNLAPDLPVIWDRQSAGTGGPSLGGEFADIAKEAGVDAVVVIPLAGPVALVDWIYPCIENSIPAIAGSTVLYNSFTQSQGGYVSDEALTTTVADAYSLGVCDFVCSSDPEEVVRCLGRLKMMPQHVADSDAEWLERCSRLENGNRPTLYVLSPEDNRISEETRRVIGDVGWHLIVGRRTINASILDSLVKKQLRVL